MGMSGAGRVGFGAAPKDDAGAGGPEEQPAVPPEVTRERECFGNHREPVHYAALAAQGCPVGSGTMESFCAQLQGRFNSRTPDGANVFQRLTTSNVEAE